MKWKEYVHYMIVLKTCYVYKCTVHIGLFHVYKSPIYTLTPLSNFQSNLLQWMAICFDCPPRCKMSRVKENGTKTSNVICEDELDKPGSTTHYTPHPWNRQPPSRGFPQRSTTASVPALMLISRDIGPFNSGKTENNSGKCSESCSLTISKVFVGYGRTRGMTWNNRLLTCIPTRTVSSSLRNRGTAADSNTGHCDVQANGHALYPELHQASGKKYVALHDCNILHIITFCYPAENQSMWPL